MMRIGELARQTGVPDKTIRYYEQVGLLPPPQRMENNYRLYAPEIVDRLRFIVSARRLGLSLREIAAVLTLNDRGEVPCGEMLATLDHQIAVVEHHINELQTLRAQLIELRQRGRQVATPWADCVCAAVRDWTAEDIV